MAMQQAAYPVQFSVEYPDRPLNRLTTAFRIFVAIPILIVLGTEAAWAAGPPVVPPREDKRRRSHPGRGSGAGRELRRAPRGVAPLSGNRRFLNPVQPPCPSPSPVNARRGRAASGPLRP
jgi:hypothetical protein